MNSYDMPLAAAKGCLAFMESIRASKSDNISPEVIVGEEHYKKFNEDFDRFLEFLKLTTSAELEVISIPEHHKRMYCVVSDVATMYLSWGDF